MEKDTVGGDLIAIANSSWYAQWPRVDSAYLARAYARTRIK